MVEEEVVVQMTKTSEGVQMKKELMEVAQTPQGVQTQVVESSCSLVVRFLQQVVWAVVVVVFWTTTVEDKLSVESDVHERMT